MKPAGYCFLLFIILAGCKKDNPEAGLPPATHEGKNTAGCLINGKPFVATGWSSGPGSGSLPPLAGGFSFDTLYNLRLYGKANGQNVAISLFLRTRRVGTHLLNQNTQYYPQGGSQYVLNHATYSTPDNTGEVYVTDSQHTGQVVLSHSNITSFMSAGTFSFTAASTFDRTKTVTITAGRFDRKQ